MSSSSPCGVSKPNSTSALPACTISPPTAPTLAAFWNRMNGIGRPSSIANAMHCAATQALFTHTCSANDAGGMLAVVRLEVVVDQDVDIGRCPEGGLHRGVVDHPRTDHHRHEEERERGGQPPPPRAVGHHRERHGPEAGELAPQRRVGAGHGRPRPGDQGGKPSYQNGVRRGRPHHRQVCRHPLIQLDEFVDLVAAELLAPLHQGVEAVPGRAVRQHERVDIHRAEFSSVAAWPLRHW